MIIEGYRELRRAIDNQVPIQTVFFCPGLYIGENEPTLLRDAVNNGARRVEVSDRVFRKMAYRDRPEGLLALAPIPETNLADLAPKLSDEPFLVIVEGIEKPGNLGTMLRSADAAGADAVLVADAVTDIFNPNVVRASLGTLFARPVVTASSREIHSWLAEREIPSFAATPFGKARYTDVPMAAPCAIVIGSEQYGLSELWMTEATKQVRIPMLGQADSLNAAQAATLLMFEVVRQSGRDKAPPPLPK